MAAKSYSLKQLKIDKANSVIVGVTSAAVFILIFSLISCRSLLSQRSYNSWLGTAQQASLDKLKADVSNENVLFSHYQTFISPSQNIIGGSSGGSGVNDGNNAQIILDALPSQYDFPALVTSMQALLSRESVKLDSIGGSDNELQYQSNTAPASVVIPISFTLDGPYQSIENVITDVQNSIRPIQIQSIQLSGGESDIQLEVTAQTFYQPEQSFSITQKAVQ
jgi:Tfp pilus assembly protein PilO